MKTFKNILIVIGENVDAIDNPAIKRGHALAKKHSAKLTLMDVVRIPDDAVSQYKGIVKPEEFTEMLVSKRTKKLEQAANSLGEGIDVSVKVAVGRDFIEIIRQMLFGDYDLLIKVANNHDTSFDSSDFHIMRKCPKPVWLLKPDDHGGSQRLLAAIDLSLEKTQEGRSLNLAIMDTAINLAKLEGSELHVLSCWSLYGESTLRQSGFVKVSDAEIERILAKEEADNSALLKALVKAYPEQKIHTHLIKGDPVDIIPNFTKNENVDVLVMGTVGRIGIPGLLIGNTSETILHLIDASVITLKPDGFESPVKG